MPPRDGSSIHPDEIKDALLEFAGEFKVRTVVMDMHRAEDIAAWVEDELGVTVIDHDHRAVKMHVADYEAFMDGLRNGTVKHGKGDRTAAACVERDCPAAAWRGLPVRPPERVAGAARGSRTAG